MRLLPIGTVQVADHSWGHLNCAKPIQKDQVLLDQNIEPDSANVRMLAVHSRFCSPTTHVTTRDDACQKVWVIVEAFCDFSGYDLHRPSIENGIESFNHQDVGS